MKTRKYSPLSRILHWISAAVIIWATLSGFFLATLTAESPIRGFLSSFNISLTTAFLPIFLFRLGYAIASKKPEKLSVPAWQQQAAAAAHALLYALTSVVLVSGVLMMDQPIAVFGLFEIPNPIRDTTWNGRFYIAHRMACATLFLMIAAHGAAVISHHRAGRRVLARMT